MVLEEHHCRMPPECVVQFRNLAVMAEHLHSIDDWLRRQDSYFVKINGTLADHDIALAVEQRHRETNEAAKTRGIQRVDSLLILGVAALVTAALSTGGGAILRYFFG